MLTPEDTRALAALSTQLGTAGTSLYTALIHKVVLEGVTNLVFAVILFVVALWGGQLAIRLHKTSESREPEPPAVITAFVAFMCAAFALGFLQEGFIAVYAPEGVVAQHVLNALHGGS